MTGSGYLGFNSIACDILLRTLPIPSETALIGLTSVRFSETIVDLVRELPRLSLKRSFLRREKTVSSEGVATARPVYAKLGRIFSYRFLKDRIAAESSSCAYPV